MFGTIIVSVLAGMAISALASIIIKILTVTVKKVIDVIKGLKKSSASVLISDPDINTMLADKFKEAKRMTEEELLKFEDEEYIIAASIDEENNIVDMKIIETEEVSEKLDSLLKANNGCICLTD